MLSPVTSHQVPHSQTPHYLISFPFCFPSASPSFVLSKDCIPVRTIYQHWKRVKITCSKPSIIQMRKPRPREGKSHIKRFPAECKTPKYNPVKYGFILYCLLLRLLLRELMFLNIKRVGTIHPISFQNASSVEDQG
uniref:Uncharacterized protein n=1 Tax=Molossus molossus TaxID=27622 RepID=A0A7J8I106_MOLMO|nr:hypothetical protein HJG59_010843 [Molossus molossus]